MTKLKTRKAVLKRFKITAKGKLLRKPVSQDHFNAKDSGKKTLSKRTLKRAAKVDVKKLKQQIPYHA